MMQEKIAEWAKQNRDFAITMGDPAGIGPEIIVKALRVLTPELLERLLVIGETDWLNRLAAEGGGRGELEFVVYGSHKTRVINSLRRVPVINPLSDPLPEFPWGENHAIYGQAAHAYVKKAVELALAGNLKGIITAPLAKHSLHLAGLDYAGHTEIISELTQAPQVAMTFWGESLKVMLVTTHIPLTSVSSVLNKELLVRKTFLLADFLRKMGVGSGLPLGVAALNPHGGEKGAFGHEEEAIIKPAIEELRGQKLFIVGPVPADVLFYQARQGRYKAVVAMYHDQGLIPFKMMHFNNGVQVTLGLPFIRTSVDHGTAFDIAGKNCADCSSLLAAIYLAFEFQRRLVNK